MTLRNYRDLRVWQQGIELARKVYAFTSGFPASERYGLTAQMRRAAVSIPSNIAEGYARTGTGEYLRFLSISSGSVAELETQVILSTEFAYLNQSQSKDLLNHLDLIGKMLQGLQRSLEPYRVQDVSIEYVSGLIPSTDTTPACVNFTESETITSTSPLISRNPMSEIRCPKREKINRNKE